MMVSLSEVVQGQVVQDSCRADVICVIDVSGSMAGEKLDNVKKTLKVLLKLLEGSRVALVTFSTAAEYLMNFKTVNKENLSKIHKVIDFMHAGSNTNVTQGVLTGQTALVGRATQHPVSAMFLLTDGQHNQGPCSVAHMFAAQSSPFTVHTFGYGDDHDAVLMQSISECRGGNYYFVDDIGRVDECFLDCLGLVTTTLATKARLSVKLVSTPYFPQLRILKTYGPLASSASGLEASIELHTLYAGMKKDLLFDLQLGGGDKRVAAQTAVVIGQVELEFVPLGQTQAKKLVAPIKVTLQPAGTAPAAQKNVRVLQNMLRVRGGEAIESAEKLRKQAQHQAALNLLAAFKNLVASEPAVAGEVMVKALLQSVESVSKMILNEMLGKKNKYKTENVVMQNRNFFMCQQSAPLQDTYQMNMNQMQKRNVAFAQQNR
jgi:CxxC motif-containing protein